MNISPYIRSCYSLLDSLVKIDDLINIAKEKEYDLISLVDFNMHGFMSFYKAISKTDIKAAYGLEIPYKYLDNQVNIILYAKDNIGIYHLFSLSSIINSDNKIIDKDILSKYLKHLKILIKSDSDLFYKYPLESLLKEFDYFTIGLVKNNYISQKRFNNDLKIKAKDLNIKCIAYPYVCYLNKYDTEAYKVLQAIKYKLDYSDKNLVVEENGHLLNIDEFHNLYNFDELKELDIFFKDLVFDIEFRKTKLPKYPLKDNISSRDYLINLARAGLNKRLKNNVSDVYLKRLNEELKVILNMHFEDYFLIVYDFILYAKKKGIMVGPGRGSAAGSLIAYVLGITDIDPIKYNLIFERFLNKDRISMPDIDVDFEDERRNEVIEYVKNKYSKKNVAHIVTYGTLKTKQVLRDVARVLNYERIDSLCKTIVNDKLSLMECYKKIRNFKTRIDNDKNARKLFEISLKLEGLPRHISTHAAGIVLSEKNLEEIIPLVKIEEDMYSVAFTLSHLEELGLIKIDFLGLRNLSVINEITSEIKVYHPNFQISNIPLDDYKTYDLISRVNTLGIFQLESSGMQNLIRELKPQTFIDIATTIALFRPGPMENIKSYLYNRKNPNTIKYIHPDLKPILEETFGIIIYQEQIMQIAQKLADFSYAKADIMRRAMAKKDENLLNSLRSDFIRGSVNNGVSENVAIKVYDLILKFANYGFNKSHSVAYALIAYEEAYLKANYPLYFYKALLNGSIASSNRTYEYLAECKRIDLKVLAPSLNKSFNDYIIEKDNLRMPFGIIKNVGSVSANFIIEEREKNGPYKNYNDAIMRLKKIGKKTIESLIDAGAFDELNLSRKTMKINLLDALKVEIGMILDDALMIKLVEKDDDLKEVAMNEKEVFGFSFSINPLLEYKKRYNLNTESIYNLKSANGYIKGFGLCTKFKEHTTKFGQKMAFLAVSDDTDSMDLVVLPQVYLNLLEIVLNARGKYVYFEGTMRNDSCTINKLEVKE